MKYPDLINPEISRVGLAESQMYNVTAGELMAGMVRSCLGPRGMDKVYVDILGEETATNRGGFFLRKLDVDHPAAKTVAEAVNTVDTHVGDGTTTTAVLIGSILSNCRNLLEAGIPTVAVIRGLERGMDYALDELDAMKISPTSPDRSVMESLARSCLAGGVMHDVGDYANLMVDTMLCVADSSGRTVDVDDIKIEEKAGGATSVRLVRGTVIDKPIDGPQMPRIIRDARVLLINDPLEETRTKTESEIMIDDPSQLGEYAHRENANLLALTERVCSSGADIVVSRKGISHCAREILAANGIISIRRVKYNDLWWLEKSTGARVCESAERILEDELGRASMVYEEPVGGDGMVFIESENPGSVTLLLQSSSRMYRDELHRTALNAACALRNFMHRPFVVYGGGACEALLAYRIREKSARVPGKVQVVLERFASALEEIPITLAENAGMDVLDAITDLRSKHAASGGGWYGIDSARRRITDVSSSDVIETVAVKEQVIKTAVEAACMIMRVDDVFVKDLIDNTHCHIDGTVHAHKDPGRNHNHWEQEGLEQRPMHPYY